MDGEESKYTQQHLANERTFLAWIRTIISIMGVGFLTTTVHFDLTSGSHPYADFMIKLIGLSTLALAFIVLIFSSSGYLRKRRGINSSSFHSTGFFVIFLSSIILVLLMTMAVYLIASY